MKKYLRYCHQLLLVTKLDMLKIPKFRLFGKDDPRIEEAIQPKLEMRGWNILTSNEKAIALQQLINDGWVREYSREIFMAIEHLNHYFLRLCPGQKLHSIAPKRELHGYDNESERIRVAFEDFKHIFLSEKSEEVVFRMLTKFAEGFIDFFSYRNAENEKVSEDKRVNYIEEAFRKFDILANCLNHIFEQFAVNALMTRNGLVPRQDVKINQEIYVPTLKVLSDPKWKNVSEDLSGMFIDFQERRYSETITKAHRATQRFLQILVGEEGKNAKGEVAELFKKAKQEKAIPVNRFTEPLIDVLQKYLVSQRATNSTAKPTSAEATSSDALLMMNVVMVFLQHCLQKQK